MDETLKTIVAGAPTFIGLVLAVLLQRDEIRWLRKRLADCEKWPASGDDSGTTVTI